MDQNEELPDETKKEGAGIVSIQCGFEKHIWLYGYCNLDEIVELLLLLLAFGLEDFQGDPEAFVEFSKLPPQRRSKAVKKRERELTQEAVDAFFQRHTPEKRTEDAPPEIAQLISFLVTYVANNLASVLNQTLFHLIQERMLVSEIVELDGQSSLRHDPDDEIACLVNEYKQELKKRVGLTRRPRKARYDLSELLNHYTTVLPLWQDAKDIYKDNRNRNWQKIINTVHPYLPDDLIARLSGNPADISDEIKAKLAEKGGSSEPSDIAVEHAARLCGAPDYGYALSTLEGKKTELNRSAKTL